MDLGLKDKVAVITGGSPGIGLAVARGLAAEGGRLAWCGRDEARIKTVPADIAAFEELRVAESGSAQSAIRNFSRWYSSAHRAPATASAAPTTWMAAG